MLTVSAFEDLQLWPIRIRLSGRTGYTLWASGDKDDILLALCGTMLLFRTKDGLRAFVENEHSCNLSQLNGYRRLRRILGTGGGTWNGVVPYHTYNFDRTARALSGGDWGRWNLRTCKAVLDCLNLIWDMAALAGDAEAIAHQEGGSELHALLNTLTFTSRKESHLLAGFDTEQIRDIYLGDLSSLARRLLWAC
ncbi:MAG TPA: hypothetical protein VFW96_20790 [Thermomicrobiales bacterium]|nr:hypothetical protein [Thermomicrobiales bacterium]